MEMEKDSRLLNAYRLHAALAKGLTDGRISQDQRGHRLPLDDLFVPSTELAPNDFGILLKVIEAGRSFENFVALGIKSYIGRCYTCGEEPELETNGVVIRPMTPCPYPHGIPLSFELNVPSGIMIVANDLRCHFCILGEYDINTRIGRVKTTKAVEQIGCAYAFVGNTCPGVYRVDENTLIIAEPGHDEENNREIEPRGEHVAGIVTDLWWYSIVDGDEFKRRGCADEGNEVDQVPVKPGVHRFTHYQHLDHDADDQKPHVFTKIEWVRPPDPVRNYQAEWDARNFTAGQVIHNSIKNYPMLYNGPDAAQRVADHIFCVVGGGGDWHSNGFVQYDPDMPPDSPETVIPVFDKPYDWYPISKYSAIWEAAHGTIHLNPSFLALARNVLTCIVKHGSASSQKEDSDQRGIVGKLLAALNERYRS